MANNLSKVDITKKKGNLVISSEFAENGLIITCNMNGIEIPNPNDPKANPIITSESKRFVFSGTATSMLDAIKTQLGLGNFFK